MICPACRSDKAGKTGVSFVSPYNEVRYTLCRCKMCRVEFWSPLNIIREIYEEEFIESYKTIHEGKWGTMPYMEHFFNTMPETGMKLLDVGCGDGGFLKEAERRGFEVCGLDFDRRSVDACRRKGLKVYPMGLFEFVEKHEELRGSFDVVSFFEVLEHQDAPLEFLLVLKKLIKPGGFVALSVPDGTRLTNKLVKLFGMVADVTRVLAIIDVDCPPHHFSWWTPSVIKRFLHENGFEEITLVRTRISVPERVNVLDERVRRVFPELGRVVPKWIYSFFIFLPLGWSVNIYCQAQLRE